MNRTERTLYAELALIAQDIAGTREKYAEYASAHNYASAAGAADARLEMVQRRVEGLIQTIDCAEAARTVRA